MFPVETMLIGEDDHMVPVKLARIRPHLVIVERRGDKARSRPHNFVAYLVEEPKRGRRRQRGRSREGELGVGKVLFILQETHFASPPDWNLKCIIDPRAWYNGTTGRWRRFTWRAGRWRHEPTEPLRGHRGSESGYLLGSISGKPHVGARRS